jgi:beta-lactamase superfamily II metal-dependent hydrolase
MLFGGDKLYMLPSVTPLQCMGFVLAGDGDVIVIDGGTKAEADELENLLLSLGGHVKGWFLTHGHFDHIEGLICVLERGKVAIDRVYYQFPPLDYIERVERAENRIARVADLEEMILKRGVPVTHPKKGEWLTAGHFRALPLSDGSPVGETLNPSSVVYRVKTRGEDVLFLGDMDWRAEDKILTEFPDQLKCRVVQMAHHGQQGVTEKFYQKVSPEICLWPTPEWLWNNDIGAGFNTGPYKTLETRAWMEKMHTTNYYFQKDITVLE